MGCRADLALLLYFMKTVVVTSLTVPRRYGLREFQFLEGTRDARRAAGYFCQFTRADYKRPIGVLSNCMQLRNGLSLGSPSFEKVQDKLVHKGLFPRRCSCGYKQTPFIGLSEDDTFRTSAAIGFGIEVWLGLGISFGRFSSPLAFTCFMSFVSTFLL